MIYCSKEVFFSQEDIANIEYITRNQIKNLHLFHYRNGRITASLFGRAIKYSIGQRNLVQTTLEKEPPFCNTATKFGQMAEDSVKEKLKEYFENEVSAEFIPTCLKIDEEYGFLGASPDSMMMYDCHNPAFLEIKCPSSRIGMKIRCRKP